MGAWVSAYTDWYFVLIMKTTMPGGPYHAMCTDTVHMTEAKEEMHIHATQCHTHSSLWGKKRGSYH